MFPDPVGTTMRDGVGQDVIERLGSRDLNDDGEIINLAIVGSSRYYDYSNFESLIDSWIEMNGYPDLIIVGGASGIDYMAERWAVNNSIDIAIFSEEWDDPRRGLAMPSATSKWTRVIIREAKERRIPIQIHELD